MIRARLSFVADATGGERCRADVFFTGVTTDSRKGTEGSLFIPLSGPNFDGHAFVKQAIDLGASCFLWQKGRPLPEELREIPCVLVADPLTALQALARAYRNTLPVRVIGITGSNGKTSTKDLCAAALSARYQTYKTPGNLNSHIGLPLCVLEWDAQTEVAVLEMGMRGKGEIAELAWIAGPEAGAITLIGEAHLAYLGTRENIALAKWELIATLPYGGLAVLPDDEPLLAALQLPAGVRRVLVGESERADLSMTSYHPTETGCEVTIAGVDGTLSLPVYGRHQARNALIALALADAFGVPLIEAVQAMQNADMTAQRTGIHRFSGLTLIDDSYNAAPASMRAGLKVLAETQGSVRLAVLGDMLELGEEEAALHAAIGRELQQYGVNALITVGELAKEYAKGAHESGGPAVLASVGNVDDAIAFVIDWLQSHAEDARIVFCKGSNRLGLSAVARAVLQWQTGSTATTAD